jgi:7-carboxy-7-deazaguanine synthase
MDSTVPVPQMAPALYSLAPNPVFWSIQGEAHLRGFQMCFIRLAGCSVGCAGCDTNYSKASTATAEQIADMAEAVTPRAASDRWVWLTGGEPADLSQMKQRELLGAIAKRGFRIAVASSGIKPFIPPVDWLSISPHSTAKLAQPYGNEIKLVMGLNALDPDEFLAANPGVRFMYQYVQPLSVNGREDRDSLNRCLQWLDKHPDWSLSRQDHHHWRLL